MTDEELIARLRNNPTDEEAEMAATRIYNLGLLNDIAEANLEAEELTNWLKLKEAEARAERLEAALEKIAAEASVTVHTKKKGGINFKKMYKGWRKIATERIDIARAALKGDGHE